MKLYTLLSFILIICGSQARSVNYKDKEIRLTDFEKVKVENFISPHFIKVFDSIIVILDPKKEEPIHILRKKDCKYLNSIGKLGIGPDEMIDPSRLDKSQTLNCFTIHDMRKKQLFEFQITNIAPLKYNQKTIIIQNFNLNSSSITKSLPLEKGLYLFISASKRDYFLFTNSKGEIIRKEGNTPDIDGLKKCNEKMYRQIFNGAYIYNYSNRKLVLAMLLNDILHIYQPDFKTYKEIKTGKTMVKYVVTEGKPGTYSSSPTTFLNIASTDNYIYTLYNGEKRSPENDYSTAKKIYKFDWEGNLISIYILPCKLTSIDIDPEQNVIYGINVNDSFLYKIKF
jgi:hypothetical protein